MYSFYSNTMQINILYQLIMGTKLFGTHLVHLIQITVYEISWFISGTRGSVLIHYVKHVHLNCVVIPESTLEWQGQVS